MNRFNKWLRPMWERDTSSLKKRKQIQKSKLVLCNILATGRVKNIQNYWCVSLNLWSCLLNSVVLEISLLCQHHEHYRGNVEGWVWRHQVARPLIAEFILSPSSPELASKLHWSLLTNLDAPPTFILHWFIWRGEQSRRKPNILCESRRV